MTGFLMQRCKLEKIRGDKHQHSTLWITAVAFFILGNMPSEAGDWPQFRGPGARGVAEGRPTPTTWNVKEEKSVAWKRPVPGLAHSSLVIWGNRLFLTCAACWSWSPITSRPSSEDSWWPRDWDVTTRFSHFSTHACGA